MLSLLKWGGGRPEHGQRFLMHALQTDARFYLSCRGKFPLPFYRFPPPPPFIFILLLSFFLACFFLLTAVKEHLQGAGEVKRLCFEMTEMAPIAIRRPRLCLTRIQQLFLLQCIVLTHTHTKFSNTQKHLDFDTCSVFYYSSCLLPQMTAPIVCCMGHCNLLSERRQVTVSKLVTPRKRASHRRVVLALCSQLYHLLTTDQTCMAPCMFTGF